MRLIDKYRPETLADVLGQAKAVARVKNIIGRPDFDRAVFWVSGPSGTGKTSLALALARELGARRIDTIELDGDSCTVDAVRKLAEMCRYYPLGPYRVVIVNEAHAVTPRAVQAWLSFLDDLPKRCVVVFTTTETRADLFGNFSAPLASRCTPIRFTSQGLNPIFAAHLRMIAQREGLNGLSDKWYAETVLQSRNNLRACIQALEAQGVAE